ncbi:hypothetical protein JW851_01235 [Candidatus Woesearchaeota archaeon]|nr:hypothetical protein [Candidatus Woesearchaeota archaeon]
MVNKLRQIRVEGLLEKMKEAEAQDFFKLNNIFSQIPRQEEGEQTLSKKLLEHSIDLYKFFGEIERKIDYLNIIQIYESFGDIFLSRVHKELQTNNIRISEAYFLISIAYLRAEKHFDPGGLYHPEHEDKDKHLANLPRKYIQLKQLIQPSEGSENLTDTQIDRLEIFLNYLEIADLDFDINNLQGVYHSFEEEMAFCKQINKKFLDIYSIKEIGFDGSWKKYKLFEKDKHSEHYTWIQKIHDFEKKHPNIGKAIRVYALDYINKKIIDNTEPIKFKSKDIS